VYLASGAGLVSSAALIDTAPDTYLDMFGVAALTHFALIFTSRGWLALLLIPIYFGYKFWGLLSGFFGKGAAPAVQETPEEADKRAKKDAKKEAKANKPKVVYQRQR
jgi:hypothetical protein